MPVRKERSKMQRTLNLELSVTLMQNNLLINFFFKLLIHNTA